MEIYDHPTFHMACQQFDLVADHLRASPAKRLVLEQGLITWDGTYYWNIAHGGYFMLVDGELHIRGMYESNDIHRLDELIRDARYLARIAK